MFIGRCAIGAPPQQQDGTTIDLLPGLAAVLLLIGANAAFVAAEFALVALDPTRLEGRGRRAERVLGLRRRLSFHLSGAQFGITVTSLLLGFLAEPTAATLLRDFVGVPAGPSILLALALATIVQMLLGELVPKNMAIARAEPTALFLGRAVQIYGVVFGPIISVLDRVSEAVVRAMGIEPAAELATARSLQELQQLFETSAEHGTLGAESSLRLSRASRLAQKSAADALVPRVDVVALEADASVQDLIERSQETGYSRFPVHNGDLDDVIGIVHVRSAQDVPYEQRATTTLGSLALQAHAVPGTASLADLLGELRSAPMTLVVDEYGGTDGILTLEDVVEELVGEIDDEHDPGPAELTVPVREGEHVVAGGLHLDELDEMCGLRLPDGPYETVAGFLLDRLGRIPERVGLSVTQEGWFLEVLAMDRHRIASVRLVEPPGRRSADEGGAS